MVAEVATGRFRITGEAIVWARVIFRWGCTLLGSLRGVTNAGAEHEATAAEAVNIRCLPRYEIRRAVVDAINSSAETKRLGRCGKGRSAIQQSARAAG